MRYTSVSGGIRAETQRRRGLVVALVLGFLLPLSCAFAGEKVVFASGERLNDAALKAYSIDRDGVEGVFVVDGDERELTGLVRWGEPAAAATRTAVVLGDGSRLLCDRPWSPAGLARIDETMVRLRRGKDWVDFPRGDVRWLLLNPEAIGFDIERLPQVDTAEGEDVVLLVGGDRLTGHVESLTNETLRLVVAGEPVDTPLESIAALRLSGELEPTKPTCLVGLTDGSLLRADRLTVADEAFTANVAGAEVTGEAATLAFVQPLSKGVSYLSDLEPADYRHTPYLDLPWPYARDAGLRGGPLVGGGRRAAKGVAMHTAARLVYRLDGSPQRFQADIAVADPEPGAAPTGSVSFRVYLVKEGKFEPAYEGGVVRVGDAATPLDIDLTGAAALALVVDFADNGDAGDDALWLDARLVPAE
jgi:hypothetical protein